MNEDCIQEIELFHFKEYSRLLDSGEEAGCLLDEPCLEQSVSRPNGRFELSYVGLRSGDWYVRHPSLGLDC